MKAIRVVVAGDDVSVVTAVSGSITADPGLDLVGTADEPDEAIRLCLAGDVDVLLLDTGLPRGGGRRVARVVRDRGLPIAIVALTRDGTRASVADAFRIGAASCVTSTEPAGIVVDTIRGAGRGHLTVSPALALPTLSEFRRRAMDQRGVETRSLAAEQRWQTLQAVFDAAPDGFVVVDSDGRIKLINATAERMFGYSPRELLGASVELLLPDHLSERHAEHRGRYMLDPGPRSIGTGTGLVGRRKDGTEIPVEIGLSPLDAAGGLLVVAAVRETTGQATRNLPQQEQLLGMLVESSPDGTLVVGVDGRIELVNQELEAMFGYPAGQLLGRSVEALVPVPRRTEHVRQRERYQEQPRRRPIGLGMDLVGRRRDGTEFPVDISLAPFAGPGRGRTMARVRDLTEQRRAERQLLLAELVRAQEDERVRIAADIHDDTIQTITAAGMRLERLAGRLTDDSQRQELEKVRAGVRDAISRLRHLMFNLRPPTLAQQGLISSLRICLDLFRAETGIRDELVADIDQEPPLDTGMLLYRAAQELLTNVSKHARAGSVRVEVREREEGYLLVVADDGRGFDGGHAVTGPGHLGLVGLRERAELAGGWCRFDGEPGHGVTAEFWVPTVDPGSRGLSRLQAPQGAMPGASS